MNELMLLKHYEDFKSRWVKALDSIKEDTVTPEYFQSLATMLSSDHLLLGGYYEAVLSKKDLSDETHLRIMSIREEVMLFFVLRRAVCVSRWLDRHNNYLDKLIGNRSIKIPDIKI